VSFAAAAEVWNAALGPNVAPALDPAPLFPSEIASAAATAAEGRAGWICQANAASTRAARRSLYVQHRRGEGVGSGSRKYSTRSCGHAQARRRSRHRNGHGGFCSCGQREQAHVLNAQKQSFQHAQPVEAPVRFVPAAASPRLPSRVPRAAAAATMAHFSGRRSFGPMYTSQSAGDGGSNRAGINRRPAPCSAWRSRPPGPAICAPAPTLPGCAP